MPIYYTITNPVYTQKYSFGLPKPVDRLRIPDSEYINALKNNSEFEIFETQVDAEKYRDALASAHKEEAKVLSIDFGVVELQGVLPQNAVEKKRCIEGGLQMIGNEEQTFTYKVINNLEGLTPVKIYTNKGKVINVDPQTWAGYVNVGVADIVQKVSTSLRL